MHHAVPPPICDADWQIGCRFRACLGPYLAHNMTCLYNIMTGWSKLSIGTSACSMPCLSFVLILAVKYRSCNHQHLELYATLGSKPDNSPCQQSTGLCCHLTRHSRMGCSTCISLSDRGTPWECYSDTASIVFIHSSAISSLCSVLLFRIKTPILHGGKSNCPCNTQHSRHDNHHMHGVDLFWCRMLSNKCVAGSYACCS
jgi:hypothetical protein